MNEDELFQSLKDLSPEQRAAHLDRACAGAAALRQRVEALLHAHDNPGSFLRHPARALGATTDEPIRERPGAVIGPYKLLQQIGEGGMGVVWMAEQTQPVQRKVAIKVIKPGMDSRQVIARFEAERQALAMMDHVNIARVYDGGATENGRPYFVMELVHGVPITKYCDDNRLTPRERLELFVPVCQAIQHAHQKGIIHRDIKPSNVMVTLYDGKPVPKVIDFGVAKATEQKLTERTLFTQYGTMVGTLEYMSPEQAEMSALGVDTRSDIYSLGVLLYELLTGSTPLGRQRVKDVAFPEILRLIKEEEPPKPSTRLSDSREALSSISAQRHMEPAALTRLVRGELDWIVMKTLEKDRNRRYETASGLAMDVECYLHDETVLACPPSIWYRSRKFARRNRTAMTTAVLVATALVFGLGASLWQMFRAIDAEVVAEDALRDKTHEYRRAEANFEVAFQVLEKIYLRVAETELPRSREVEQEQEQQKLLRAILQFYEAFAAENDNNPKAINRVAWAHARVGELHRLLGQHAEAEQAFKQALKLGAPATEAMAGKSEQLYLQAMCNGKLGQLYKTTGQLAKAETAWDQALVGMAQLRTEFPGDAKYRTGWANCKVSLGSLFRHTGRVEAAEHADRAALAEWRALASGARADSQYLRGLANACANFGILLQDMERPGEALQVHDEAIDLYTKLAAQSSAPEYRHSLANSQLNRGKALRTLGRRPEAEQAYRKAIDLAEALVLVYPQVPDYQLQVAFNTTMYADMLEDKGEYAEAEKAHRAAMKLAAKLADKFPGVPDYKHSLAGGWHNLGTLLEERDRLTEAEQAYLEAQKIWQQLATEVPATLEYRLFLQKAAGNLGGLLAAQGRHEDAEKVYRDALRIAERLAQDYPQSTRYQLELARCHNRVGHVLMDSGRLPAAEKSYLDSMALAKKLFADHDSRPVYRHALESCWHNLARVQIAAGRLEDAESAWQQCADHMNRLVKEFPEHAGYQADLALTYHNRGDLLKAKKQPSEAEKAYRKAIALRADLVNRFPNNRENRKCLIRVQSALGHLLFFTGRKQDSLALYEELHRTSPDERTFREGLAFTLHELGTDAFSAGRLKEAEKTLLRAAGLMEKLAEDFQGHSKYRRLWANDLDYLSILCLFRDRLPQAEKSQRQAIAVLKDLVLEKNPTKAGPAPKSVSSSMGPNVLIIESDAPPDDRLDLANYYLHLSSILNAKNLARPKKDFGEVEQLYRDALKMAPKCAGAHNDFAWFRATCADVDFRNPAEAVKHAKMAVELEAEVGGYWNTLGLAHYRAGELEQAIAALHKAMKLEKGGSGFDWYFLAMAHWQVGNQAEAREWYDKAVAWKMKNEKGLANQKVAADELRRFHAEATALMDVQEK